MPSDIRGKKRNANVSAARQMTMYIIREVTGMSMEAIGQEFAARSFHGGVFHQNDGGKHRSATSHLKETVQRHHEKRPHLSSFLERKEPKNF